MSKRTEALWRIVALLWAFTIGGLLAGIIMFLALIVGAVDIIIQLVFGVEAFKRSGLTLHTIAESWMWWTDLNVYALTGKGDGFEWIPSLDR